MIGGEHQDQHGARRRPAARSASPSRTSTCVRRSPARRLRAARSGSARERSDAYARGRARRRCTGSADERGGGDHGVQRRSSRARPRPCRARTPVGGLLRLAHHHGDDLDAREGDHRERDRVGDRVPRRTCAEVDRAGQRVQVEHQRRARARPAAAARRCRRPRRRSTPGRAAGRRIRRTTPIAMTSPTATSSSRGWSRAVTVCRPSRARSAARTAARARSTTTKSSTTAQPTTKPGEVAERAPRDRRRAAAACRRAHALGVGARGERRTAARRPSSTSGVSPSA